MWRLATITAFALALTVAPLSLASADAAPQVSSHSAVTNVPATPQWVYYNQYPALWICQYVGNQLVAGGTFQNYECRAGTPGQLALWGLTY